MFFSSKHVHPFLCCHWHGTKLYPTNMLLGYKEVCSFPSVRKAKDLVAPDIVLVCTIYLNVPGVFTAYGILFFAWSTCNWEVSSNLFWIICFVLLHGGYSQSILIKLGIFTWGRSYKRGKSEASSYLWFYCKLKSEVFLRLLPFFQSLPLIQKESMEM
jgi:hypothetical protein